MSVESLMPDNKPRMATRGKPLMKASLRNERGKDLKDEIFKKFSRNLKKALEDREHSTENGTQEKTVKFNQDVIETSFGGTQTKMRLNANSSVASSVSLNTFDDTVPQNKQILSLRKEPFPARKMYENHLEIKNRLRNTSGVNHTESPMKTPTRKHLLEEMVEATGTPECFNPVAFETPVSVTRSLHQRRSSVDMQTGIETDSTSMTVAVRVRPFSQRDTEENAKCVVSMIDNETVVTDEKGQVHRFTYDFSFWSFDKISGDFAGQEYVYNVLAQPMLGKAFEGYNVCLFAYGQTGSGKSYCIMGHEGEDGVIPRFCQGLFSRIDSSTEEKINLNVEISFFEIYNEKIHDLLGQNKDKTGKKPNLKVREHPLLGPFVEGLSSYVVKCFEDVKGWLNVGNKHRATASTGMNDKSSRSHSVFTMVLTQTRIDTIEGEDHEHSITSKINLVDLAGSERQSHAKTSGDRLREGASINKSLHTLGKVISTLAEQPVKVGKKKKIFIPYRDSVLTWLLKESIGGNSKTAMLATISPANQHVEESLSTLRYAKQARSIVNIARVNEDPKARLIRELRAEIEKLKAHTGENPIGVSMAEIVSLKDKLANKEKEMMEITRSWQERLKQSEQRRLEESHKLEKSGIAFKIDNKLPNLVNLNEDPQLSEMLLYVLKEGETKVGRMRGSSTHDIQLNGPLIADDHCYISYCDKKVTLTPIGDAVTYVNGDLVAKKNVLHHGDRVILGGDHYFRFNHPIEVEKGRKSSIHKTKSGQVKIKDFDFARQELMHAQNKRLEIELEEAKRKQQEEMNRELKKKEVEAQMKMKKELDKQKKVVEKEMIHQKDQYEDKLAELEKELIRQKNQQVESVMNQKEANYVIKMLERQKLMLEQEVLSNRKRLEMEAKESQKSVAESRLIHSKLVEQLEKEKEKIRKDVVRLEAMRNMRGSVTNTPKLTPARQTSVDSSKKDLYKIALLLREAQKISQYLKKDTVFTREDVVHGDEVQNLVKVTNTKLGISTFWTMNKFEDRLLQMREVYQQGELENSSGESDDIFYNPNDCWEKEDRIGSSPRLSPRMVKGLHKSLKDDSVLRLSFSSEPSPKPQENKTKEKDTLSEVSNDSGNDDNSSTVISLCRGLIAQAVDQFSDDAIQESVTDKILWELELVKLSVTNVLDIYNQSSMEGLSKETFIEMRDMHLSVIQLTNSVKALLSLCALWTSACENLGAGLIKSLCTKVTTTVKKLSNQMVLFLQGCENDIDSMIQESASQILDCVFELCKYCGELSLATNTRLTSLKDIANEDTLEEEIQDVSRARLGHDIRQAFISGCDMFLDKTLQTSIRTTEECEIKVKTFGDDSAAKADKNEMSSFNQFLRQAKVTICSVKVLLKKCQEVQVQLDTSMRDSLSSDTKPADYYHRNYCRSQSLLTHIGNLTDYITSLTHAAQVLSSGDSDGIIRKLCRCLEIIQKSAVKILAVSYEDPCSNISSNNFDTSVLSDNQLEELDVAAQNVKVATSNFVRHLKQRPDFEVNSPLEKSKKPLHISPEKMNWERLHLQNNGLDVGDLNRRLSLESDGQDIGI